VVLAPKSKWKNAIEEVNNNEAKTHLKEKLFSLIGKLQSYDNRNTRQIEIPDEFKVNKAKDDVDWRCSRLLGSSAANFSHFCIFFLAATFSHFCIYF